MQRIAVLGVFTLILTSLGFYAGGTMLAISLACIGLSGMAIIAGQLSEANLRHRRLVAQVQARLASGRYEVRETLSVRVLNHTV